MTSTLIVGPSFPPAPALPRFRRLVVCLDGSRRAAAAVPTALRYAEHIDLRIDLVHVADPDDDPDARAAMREQLAATQRRLVTAGCGTETVTLTGSDPAEAIAGLLAEDPTTIAVVGSHGRTGLARMLLGSITMDLIERSPVPLLITPTTGPT